MTFSNRTVRKRAIEMARYEKVISNSPEICEAITLSFQGQYFSPLITFNNTVGVRD
jgi:hypothetical protein